MPTARWAARIGAGFYVLWGIFHLVAASSVYVLAEQSSGMVRGRLLQDASYLVFFAISVTSLSKFFPCELLSKRSSW